MAITPRRKAQFSVVASNLENLREQLRQFPDDMATAIKAEFFAQISVLKTLMVQRSSNPPGPVPAGAGVREQTKRLKNSWVVEVTGNTVRDIRASAYSLAQKAATLEFGLKVEATLGPSGNWIFIPTDINRKATGEAILTPQDVLNFGGSFINRRRRRWQDVRPAIVDGTSSPAWNLLVTAQGDPMFIMAKWAQYRPLLGFYDTGQEFSKVLPGTLGDNIIKAFEQQKSLAA
jgi:hypothetical protein